MSFLIAVLFSFWSFYLIVGIFIAIVEISVLRVKYQRIYWTHVFILRLLTHIVGWPVVVVDSINDRLTTGQTSPDADKDEHVTFPRGNSRAFCCPPPDEATASLLVYFDQSKH